MENIKRIISSHNSKILSEKENKMTNKNEPNDNNKNKKIKIGSDQNINKNENNENINKFYPFINRGTKEKCNCRSDCPIKDDKYNCRDRNVIYEATVEHNGKRKFYIGLTSMEFKQRRQQHKSTFNNRKQDTTTLANYIWKLKDKKEQYNVTWKILQKVGARKSGDKKCKLCLLEILKILDYKKKHGENCINKRDEFTGACRHKKKFKLQKWTEKIK